MKKVVLMSSLLAVTLLTVLAAGAALAHDDNGKGKARLTGLEETPLTLLTSGRGSFRAKVRSDGIHYTLRYEDLEANATVAHIHFGLPGITGGVIAFLCGGGGKPACPTREGEVTGVITGANVIGPAAQGLDVGSLTEAVRALRKGAVYANVHSTTYPGGEIRGQVGSKGRKHKNGHDD